jgi:hypothetical protein
VVVGVPQKPGFNLEGPGFSDQGRQVSVSQRRNFTEYFAGGRGLVVNDFNDTQTYDGDGQIVQFVRSWTVNGANATDFPVTAYYLRSTVLGGRLISEYNGQGQLNTSYAYAGDARVGQFSANYNHTTVSPYWRFADPVTGDQLETVDGGQSLQGQATLDPNGVDVALADPFPPDGSGNDTGGDFDTNAKLRAVENNGAQCLINGTELMDCRFVSPESTIPVQPSVVIQGTDEQGNKSIAWLIFNGAGYWVPNGGDTPNLFFDDVRFGSALDANAMNLLGQKKKKKPRGRRANPTLEVAGGMTGIPLPIAIEHFDSNEEKQIRATFDSLFSDRCAEAFRNARLRTPQEVASGGLVLRPSTDLITRSATELQIVSESLRIQYREEFFGNTAFSTSQAGTIRAVRDGVRQTTDGRTQIYLDRAWAFNGESWFDRTFSLQDVMSHEFIHGGGQGPKPGRWGRFRHDLAGFGPHDTILAACR